MGVRARRLDDRIRELCEDAVATKNTRQVKSILSELQAAIHQYTYRLRARAAALLTGRTDLVPERRNVLKD